jgi:hypothetical protein
MASRYVRPDIQAKHHREEGSNSPFHGDNAITQAHRERNGCCNQGFYTQNLRLASMTEIALASRERQIHVPDRFIDFLRVLETDRGAIHSRVLESEPHGFHTIVMTTLELTATAELHANHT